VSRVVVMGQGYVGLPMAMRAVDVGHTVIGYEPDRNRLRSLLEGSSYVEDVSSESLKAALASGRYVATADSADLAGFDVAVISVPTPLREHAPDLAFVRSASELLGPHTTIGSCVVLESTTYPGTTEEVMLPILEELSGLKAGPDFYVGYSPERIDPGNKKWDFVTTPKIVSGMDESSCKVVQEFYDTIVNRTVAVPGTREAELAKVVENTFRHVNIALVNELAIFAHDLGIDLWSVLDACDTKPFGYMRFNPGPGVGGHCLPIDPSYLSWHVKNSLGHNFRFVELANDVNEHMPEYVVRRLTSFLNERERSIKGSSFLLLGLAYKKNTGDARESPAIHVAQQLHALGGNVRAVDPLVEVYQVPSFVERTELTQEAIERADVIVLLTDHDSIDLAMLAPHLGKVFDTRNHPALAGAERI
jgi:UDP-N-acetyl-D-glucosamine dehydrogenase